MHFDRCHTQQYQSEVRGWLVFHVCIKGQNEPGCNVPLTTRDMSLAQVYVFLNSCSQHPERTFVLSLTRSSSRLPPKRTYLRR